MFQPNSGNSKDNSLSSIESNEEEKEESPVHKKHVKIDPEPIKVEPELDPLSLVKARTSPVKKPTLKMVVKKQGSIIKNTTIESETSPSKCNPCVIFSSSQEAEISKI